MRHEDTVNIAPGVRFVGFLFFHGFGSILLHLVIDDCTIVWILMYNFGI